MTDPDSHYDVVIVGAGHGGAQTAISLREAKFEGSIALVSDEADWPYERPPLSKEFLAGDKPFERILLRKPEYWEERAIHLLKESRVTAIDPASHTATLADGSTLSYGKLVWAAGGRPHRLRVPGAELAGNHAIRSAADIRGLMTDLDRCDSVVVAGGGYIGLEAAAVLRKMGKHVTIVEMQDRVLSRVAGPAVAQFLEARHRHEGVDLRLKSGITAIHGESGRVCSVELADGTVIPAGIVIVGIGIAPETGPLIAAGAAGDNGVAVDGQGRTSLPDVFALGDVALHANRFAGGAAVRIESVQNAVDMARVVARTICGQEAVYDAVPWFWSNQYDVKLQTVGLAMPHDATVLRGDPAGGSFSCIYLLDGRVVALDCLSASRDFVQGRKLVEAGAMISPAMLADPDISLKSLL